MPPDYSQARTHVFGREVGLVLQYTQDGLSSIGYLAIYPGNAPADSLFEAVLGFYTGRWGLPTTLDEELVRVRLWSTPECDTALIGSATTPSIVSWGSVRPGVFADRVKAGHKQFAPNHVLQPPAPHDGQR